MTQHISNHATIGALLDRLARITSADTWDADLNPAQSAALGFLAKANRFSRSPSVVAEFLGATRGTVSQTLKALQRKGLVSEIRNIADKRSISYEVTKEGRAQAGHQHALDVAVEALSAEDRAHLEHILTQILSEALRRRGAKSFGICRTCLHHRMTDKAHHCALLDLQLTSDEAGQVCVEHSLD